MKIVDAIAEILKREGVEFLSAYPTTPVIDAAAAAGIRPVLCRQERVGVGIADGYTRTTNGRRPGVFAMQYGPGAENAYVTLAKIHLAQGRRREALAVLERLLQRNPTHAEALELARLARGR